MPRLKRANAAAPTRSALDTYFTKIYDPSGNYKFNCRGCGRLFSRSAAYKHRQSDACSPPPDGDIYISSPVADGEQPRTAQHVRGPSDSSDVVGPGRGDASLTERCSPARVCHLFSALSSSALVTCFSCILLHRTYHVSGDVRTSPCLRLQCTSHLLATPHPCTQVSVCTTLSHLLHVFSDICALSYARCHLLATAGHG